MIEKKYKITTLYDIHVNLNAKMVSYAGYLMPVNYTKGIQFEYDAVRKKVGMFDVSHMGQIIVSGKNALDYLQHLTVNDVSLISNGEAQYNAICNNLGGIKDDIIIYKINEKYILIVNASNYKKICSWMLNQKKYECDISCESEKFSLIALQGPKSRELLSELINQKINLNFYKHKEVEFNKCKILLSRTGYTGELGFEILGDNKIITEIWKKLYNLGVVPCGLAVRDILRMEMKYCLYGNDIDEDTTPFEAGLNWIVKLSKNNFIGKDVLLKQKESGFKKKLIAFEMLDKCIPRKGYNIYFKNNFAGNVTSGTFSLSLKKGIGLGYINIDNFKLGDEIYIEIRDKKNKGKIIKPPFIKSYSIYD